MIFRESLTITLAGIPPVGWNDQFELLDANTAQQLSRDLDSAAIGEAHRAAYFAARSRGESHAKAVRSANSVKHKVRVALGYHIRDDVSF